MTITEYEYAATTVRALMAAEAAMASVNFEQAIPWTEINPLDRRS